MEKKNYNVGILGTGSFLPEKNVSNKDLEKLVDTSDEWIVKRTGISNRRLLEADVPGYTMGIEAAKRALENADVKPEELDLIVVTTNTPDYITPTTSCIIQGAIGAVNASALDMNAACTGFIYSLELAEQYIMGGKYKKILIVAVESMSKVVDWEDRNTCVLFGDASGAVVLGRVESGYGLLNTCTGAFGEKGFVLSLPCFYANEEDLAIRPNNKQTLWMDGSEVFKYAVNIMAEASKKAVEGIQMTFEDIDKVFPHQANIRIIEGAVKRMKIDMNKVYSNLADTGNISSASIPLGLDIANRNGNLKKGDTLLMVGFGGGLTWGASVLKWSKE